VPSILVADDNTNIQKMVSLAFEDRGITVVAVGNGEAAVRRIPDMNPDLVLADIFMPVRNGYEVCEFVKKDERFAHVPVILLVGAFDPLDEKEARRVGADGVLKKPFVPPDPLIAMVISALEKNPRVVAELAKAKAPVEPPAMADAAASFDVQNVPKPEPKPLPEFPEPTPEEAALVYGFGKGVRAIDDEELEAGKEPPAPVSHRDDQDQGDDDEGAATTSDWRRNAMDFDIPEEHANRPAFSSLDDLEPATFFPSEAEARKPVPPAPKIEPPAIVARDKTAQFAPVAAAEDANPHVVPIVAQEVDMRALEPVEATPVERAPISFPKETDAAPPTSFAPRAVVAEPPAVPEPQLAPEPEAEAEQDHEAKPSLASRMRHWMDAIVSSPATQQTHKEAPQETHEVAKADDWVAKLAKPRSSEVAVVEQQPAPSELPQAIASAAAKPAEESFFADESAPEESAAAESTPVEVASAEMVSSEVAPVEEAPVEAASSTVESGDVAPTFQSGAHSSGAQSSEALASKPGPEIWDRDEETIPSFRDPDLDVPPAVHVTPEPLLLDEEPEAVSSYREQQHEAPSAHTFEVAMSPEPVDEDAPADQPSLPEALFAPAAGEHDDERVPTGPPPNREALAEIPFLNPPQGFDPNARPAQSSAADASTVDAVVEKLLERLQPQLHELLSQSVLKPLVESLLQQENNKKEK
jgi:CheY-like chemotaxis protein